MRGYDKLDKRPKEKNCSNRFLLFISVLLFIQTLMSLSIVVSIAIAYEDHRDDIQALSEINWGATANNLVNSLNALDARKIDKILDNANNASVTAQYNMQTHGKSTLENLHAFSDEAKSNKNIFTDVRQSLIEVRRPIKDIVELLGGGTEQDLKQIIHLVRAILINFQQIPVKEILHLILEVMKSLKTDLNPKNIEAVVNFANSVNNFVGSNETQTLTKNTNKALLDTDKILNRIFNVDKNIDI